MIENIKLHQHRVAATKYIIIIGCLTAAVASIANFWLYGQTSAWQMLMMGITEAVVVGGLMVAFNLARKDQLDEAGYLALAMSFIAFGAGELVHQGFTGILATCGALMIIMIGLIILPHRFYLWLPVLILFGLYFVVANRLDLFQRYDIRGESSFRIVIIVVIVMLVLIAIWQFWGVIRFSAIRTRLLISFVALALLPAVLIASLATYFGVQSSIGQTQALLGSVADLKKNQLINWISGLEATIQIAVPSEELVQYSEVLTIDPESVDSDVYQAAYQSEKARYNEILNQSGAFSELFLVDLNGKVVLSTDVNHENRIEFGYPYFELGAAGNSVAAPPAQYPYTNQLALIVVAPVKSTAGDQIAILAGQADLSALGRIMGERAGLGSQGEAYLMVTKTLQLFTQTTYSDAQVGDYIYSFGISEAGEKQVNDQTLYINPWETPVIGAFRALPEMGMVLLVEQPQAIALSPVYRNTIINILLTVGTVAIAVVMALLVTSRITRPIAALASTAEQISQGNLTLEATVEQQDEIGILAGAFNDMTAQLRKTLEGLEDLVRERTAALERRTGYLQTSADISRTVATVLDPDQLIQQVVELIRNRFDLYYVGLFLLDPEKQFAILRAGTGIAGQKMLDRQHRIKVGSGMIGWCVAYRNARIAQRAELDASRLANPDLPDTRAEAAIPLISRGEVIGALTIQSTQPDIFEPETIAVFETMAEQVAVALDNARLFVQSQQTLETLRAVYREISLQGWRELLAENPHMGYRSEVGKPITIEPDWSPELVTTVQTGRIVHSNAADERAQGSGLSLEQAKDAYYLGIPLLARGNVIGVLGCYKPVERGDWTDEEVTFLQEVGQTISIALESARFFTDVQMRAESERVVAEVTEKLRQTLDVDTVLTTAVHELQRILDLAEVEIRMNAGSQAQ